MTLNELYLRCVTFLYDTPIHICYGSSDFIDLACEIAVIKRSDFGNVFSSRSDFRKVFSSWSDFADHLDVKCFEIRGDNDSNYEVYIFVDESEVKDNEIIQFFQNLRQNEKI